MPGIRTRQKCPDGPPPCQNAFGKFHAFRIKGLALGVGTMRLEHPVRKEERAVRTAMQQIFGSPFGIDVICLTSVYLTTFLLQKGKILFVTQSLGIYHAAGGIVVGFSSCCTPHRTVSNPWLRKKDAICVSGF